MLVLGENFRQHRPWIVVSLLAALGAVAWYVAYGFRIHGWPAGSSWPGFVFGVAGGLIILFETFLWPRKKVRTWRIGPVKLWLKGHIWLGLLCLPLLILHSGFRWGGLLSTVLLSLLIIVIVSGVVGLVLQQYLPKFMLHQIPAETIRSQIDHVLARRLDETERQVLITCGSEAPGEEIDPAFAEMDPTVTHITVGAVRTAGRISGKVLETRVAQGPIPESDAIRPFFFDLVKPYIRKGGARPDLAQPGRRDALITDLKTKVNPAAHGVVDEIGNLCELRRQLDRQIVAHRWIHGWLLIHLPLSFALVLLMFVHIVYALKYL